MTLCRAWHVYIEFVMFGSSALTSCPVWHVKVRTIRILPAGHSLSCCFSKAFEDYSHQEHLDSGATYDRSSRDQGVVGTVIKYGIRVKV